MLVEFCLLGMIIIDHSIFAFVSGHAQESMLVLIGVDFLAQHSAPCPLNEVFGPSL